MPAHGRTSRDPAVAVALLVPDQAGHALAGARAVTLGVKVHPTRAAELAALPDQRHATDEIRPDHRPVEPVRARREADADQIGAVGVAAVLPCPDEPIRTLPGKRMEDRVAGGAHGSPKVGLTRAARVRSRQPARHHDQVVV